MKQVKGGVTAAKDLKQQVQQQESSIKTEQIWHWYTARFHAWQQEHLQQMS